MPIKDIIGGATAASGASVEGPSEKEVDASGALSDPTQAGVIARNWLNQQTPAGIEWQLNFDFIAAVLSGLSTIVTLTNWVT